REEVAERGELRVLVDELVRLLLEGEPDVDAEAPLAPRALLAGAHDAAARAGDDHVALGGDAARELVRGAIGGRVGAGAGGAEDAHLPDPGVGREHLEGVAQLAQRGVQELHLGDARLVAQELQARLDHLAHELLLAVQLPVRLQAGEQLGEQALSAADPGGLSWQQLGSSSFAYGEAPLCREVPPVASLPLAPALGYLPARGVA